MRQHGTARFASKQEIKATYQHIPFQPMLWRQGKHLPSADQQGIILGSTGAKNKVTALVDTDDVHCLMIGASGVGKTAFFLYPNLEYACASGMSFLTTDTKGDLYRNYGAIAQDHYGYQVAVIDLRNPTRSDGNNMLHLVNTYMDEYLENETNLVAKAKAEKYAKIISKTIINAGGENYGQNQFFYDAAEGLLSSVILLIAEYLPPTEVDGKKVDCRHIISVFKLVQDLLAPSKVKGKSQFQLLMDKLPSDHKARWFAGAALNSAEQAMASVLSTVLSRLNAFLDSEMEQVLCFDTAIDAAIHFLSFRFSGRQIFGNQQNDRGQKPFGGIVEELILPEIFTAGIDDGLGDDFGIFLCLCLLPAATCDYTQFPALTLPRAETRRFQSGGTDYLFIRNLYETRRMQYTLYNAIGANGQTWENGTLKLRGDGTPVARVQLFISDDAQAESFWPWRADQIAADFESCPPGFYQMEAWDVYANGKYLYTEYRVAVGI